MPPHQASSGLRTLGADRVDVALALALALVLWALTLVLDRALESPPREDLTAVGIVADPHHVHIGAIYGSFARESAEGGGLRVHNHQTAEPHGAALARPWDWLVGRLGGTAEPRRWFAVERLAGLLLFPLGCALLLGELLRSRLARGGALVALVSGGSLYWLRVLAGPGSAFDQHLATWLRDQGGLSGLGFAYPALLLGVPHLALEIAFFAGGLGAALGSRRRDSLPWAAAAGLLLFLLACVRPYTAPAALAGAGLALVWGRWRRGLAPATLALVPTLPLLWHYAWVLRGESVFAALDVVHPAPRAVEQALFCGVPVLLAGAWLLPAVRRRRRALGRLPTPVSAALGTSLALLLVVVLGPFVSWQVEALLPLPLFAVLAAALAWEGLGARARWVGAAVLVLHAVPSAFYGAEVARRLDQPGSDYWILAAEREALARLETLREGTLAQDRPPAVLLCEPTFGRLVPWLAGVRVYAGHTDHTPGFAAKARRAQAFFRYGVGAAELAPAGVTHVLVSPRLGPERADLDALEELELVFASGDVRLYAVVGDGG